VDCASRFHHQQNLFWQRAWLFGIALALCALMGAQRDFSAGRDHFGLWFGLAGVNWLQAA